jgi:hypothetical protein
MQRAAARGLFKTYRKFILLVKKPWTANRVFFFLVQPEYFLHRASCIFYSVPCNFYREYFTASRVILFTDFVPWTVYFFYGTPTIGSKNVEKKSEKTKKKPPPRACALRVQGPSFSQIFNNNLILRLTVL